MPEPERMTDAEALMWNVEKDPALRSSFLNVTLLDRPPDFDRLRRRLGVAVGRIPRLRRRVVSPPARLAPPRWVDDPDFDLDYHVRRLAVPAPGSDRQLFDLAARTYEDAFDRARPLWLFHVVEGLADGRAALLSKMHHTITDGVGGVRLSMQFIDLEADPPEEPEPEVGGVSEAAEADRVSWATDAVAHDTRAWWADAAGTATHNLRRQLGIARRSAASLAAAATHPTRLPAIAGDAVAVAQSLARQAAVTEPARSPLWTSRSLGRRFEALSLDLDGLKRAAKAFGGTVNDAFVTVVAGAAGAYHRAEGADVDELRMSMPVAARGRERGAGGGNAFAPARVLVPAGQADAVERFRVVHERLAVTKQERALGLTDALATVLNALPTALVVRVARAQVETVDFTASNLRGADLDLYIAGARILSNHPMGPTAGTAFNATVLGYKDRLDLGLDVDTAAVARPELLRDCISAEMDELVAAL